MIFIGGISQGRKILDYVRTVICGCCGRYGRYEVIMTYTYFSFFFIPLFKWNRQFYVRMTCCGAVYSLEKDVGQKILAGQDVEITAAAAVTRPLRISNTAQSAGSGFEEERYEKDYGDGQPSLSGYDLRGE